MSTTSTGIGRFGVSSLSRPAAQIPLETATARKRIVMSELLAFTEIIGSSLRQKRKPTRGGVGFRG
jgi:hypothetical protein